MRIPSREDDKFLIRLPDGLRGRIKKKAKENLRSMNSEIIFQLMCLYPDSPETKKADATA